MKIANDIYSVGVLNPNLRVFDIIMKTDYGTSYNSYLIKDNDGDILIDTVHDSYSEIFFKNIAAISDIKKIKYLIVNHCEPDHSGSIHKILEINPKITIYCSMAAKNFLSEITNIKNINFNIVNDNTVIKTKQHDIRFKLAPLLHWPDSIFTYLKSSEDNKIYCFTCDFLGSHYCEPTMLDSNIKFDEAYWSAFKNYYDCIFGPFSKAVINGLNLLKIINPNFICPSHGPILSSLFIECVKKYQQWSTITTSQNKNFPIFYVSAYGYTKIIANQIALEAKKHGLTPKLYDIIKNDFNSLIAIMNKADYFAIGTPTINRNALPPVVNLLSMIDSINSANKKILVFGSFGWSGEGTNIVNEYLKSMKLNVFDTILKFKFKPNNQDLLKISQITNEFLTSFVKINH